MKVIDPNQTKLWLIKETPAHPVYPEQPSLSETSDFAKQTVGQALTPVMF